MIRDSRALQLEFVPQELQHRRNAIQHLSSALRPITHGLEGDDALITGPSGAGKTTLARYVVQQLTEQTVGIQTGYVNCMGDASSAAALHTLLRDAGIGVDLAFEGTARTAYLRRIRESENDFVFIFDEVDVLEGLELLGALYNEPNVTLILITIDGTEFLADDRLDPRIASRVRSFQTIHLEPYSREQLEDILWDRINAGLDRTRIDSGAVERMASLAWGNARFAIALLARAVKAVAGTTENVTTELVDEVADEARDVLRTRTLEQLSTHQRLLYEIVDDYGELKAGELHEQYERRVGSPRPRSTRRNYLASLERYGLIESHGAGRGTRYTVAAHR